VVLSFESVDVITWCDHPYETSLEVLSRGAIYILQNEIWDLS